MTRTRPTQLNLPDGAELLTREMYMARRLEAYGCDVFAGSSDTDSRKRLFRRVITERGLDQTILGADSSGYSVTYAEAFLRTYGEPLQPRSTRPVSRQATA